MKHHLFYSTRTIGSIIGIVGLTVMVFITACVSTLGGSTTSTGGTATSGAVITSSPTCTTIGCLECVMGYHSPIYVFQLLSQYQQGFIVFSTQVVDVGGNGGGAGNYRITASIPAGLLPNAITEVDINSKTDTSAVNNAVLRPGQVIIIAAVLNPTLHSFTGIQILPSNPQFVNSCRRVVEFVIPMVGQNKTVTYWQGGGQPLSFDLDKFPPIDVTKPVEVFTEFHADSSSTVFKVQNVG